MTVRSLLLIQLGTPPDDIRAQVGDLPRWFTAAVDRDPQEFEIVRVFEGEPLPEPAVYRAAIITGSWSMVTDQHAWSEATAEWIRRAVAINTPLFGVCYGHQLMAHALGGQVGYHPQGREMGCMDIELLPLAENEPLLAGAPQRFKAHLTHLQTVVRLPAGAKVLARSAHDPHQVVRYSPTAISTQFHPEFTQAISSACICTRKHMLRDEGLDPVAMLSQLDDTPTPLLMLRRFVEAYA